MFEDVDGFLLEDGKWYSRAEDTEVEVFERRFWEDGGSYVQSWIRFASRMNGDGVVNGLYMVEVPLKSIRGTRTYI